MKKLLLSLSLVALATGAALAQNKVTAAHDHQGHNHDSHGHETAAPVAAATPAAATATAAPAAASTLTVDNMAFKAESHDFGTVEEGPAAEYVFAFTNTGKEPLTIQRVQASCGCTTPDWSKEPILPGKSGIVKASYGTAGRPGHFEKTLTVFSNAGTKMLSIKGDVEKAPETSAPQNNSMIRTN